MESTLHRMQSLYQDMGHAERKIADYILNHSSEMISHSVTELSTVCGCSDATVVRFSRRLGYSGYQALKLGLARELDSASTISGEIRKSDTCFEIFQKRILDISSSLKNTEAVLDSKKLEEAAVRIMHARRIVIFGSGNSAPVALDAAHKFSRLGLDAAAFSDNHMQAIIASHLSPETVVVAVSHSGSSRDIVEAVQLAGLRGAFCIGITNFGSSPLVDKLNIALFTKSDETKHSILAMSSRIAQLTIFDALYTYIVLNLDQTAVQAVYDTENALQTKKY